MNNFLLHVGVSPYNSKLLPLANPCFQDGSFIFVPWCTGTNKDHAPNEVEYRDLVNPVGVRELLQFHPTLGTQAIDYKTQNNPDLAKCNFSEWFMAARTARLFPRMQIGSKVYFAASFVKIEKIPSLQKFIAEPETYRVPISMCFSKYSYSSNGFIGVFAHITIKEIIGDEEYLKKYSNAQKKEASNWNTLCSCNVLIKGDSNSSSYWNRVVPIGKGNRPSPDFEQIYSKGKIMKWSGIFNEDKAKNLLLFFSSSSQD